MKVLLSALVFATLTMAAHAEDDNYMGRQNPTGQEGTSPDAEDCPICRQNANQRLWTQPPAATVAAKAAKYSGQGTGPATPATTRPGEGDR